MTTQHNQPQPIIILVEPQLAENIGTTARAMLNFGLVQLRLVNPRSLWPSDRAIDCSAGALQVLEQCELYRSFAEATADCRWLYAASARPRDLVKRIITPRQAATELRQIFSQPVDKAATPYSPYHRAAILFGPERTGLINEDIALVDRVITIPVNPQFSSLNLAQAVMVLAYEWHLSSDQTAPESLRIGGAVPAEKQHLFSYLQRLEQELEQCGFLRNDHMRAAMVRNLQALYSRAELTDQELRTLHGILTELVTRRLRKDD